MTESQYNTVKQIKLNGELTKEQRSLLNLYLTERASWFIRKGVAHWLSKTA